MNRGFTLIELSIVLVIIGLIVGGVLVGQDLIQAAQIRATISQIEKYQTAVNTFRGKYGALPGDMNNTTALQFGFSARGTLEGQGDGNGLIEGYYAGMNTPGTVESTGETVVFWEDLTTANGQNLNMVDGSYGVASISAPLANSVSGTGLDQYFPPAKLGGGNYIQVWSGAAALCSGGGTTNWYAISYVTGIQSTNGLLDAQPGLKVRQAYQMDKKVDDGQPQTGRVVAIYPTSGGCGALWAGPNGPGAYDPTSPYGAVVSGDGVATSGTTQTCYDNGNVAGATEQYSLSQNNGNGVNCALSFQFQ